MNAVFYIVTGGLILLVVFAIYASIEQRQQFTEACYAAGGNRVERVWRTGLFCWDTEIGQRIFP